MFDSDHDKGERSRKAYREGAKGAKRAGFWGHVMHEFDDAAAGFFPQSAESKANDAGWHDYSDKKYRYKRRRKTGRFDSSAASRSSSSGSHGIIALIGFVIVVGGVVWLGRLPIRRHGQNQEVWTMRRVKATKLNIRSAPGIHSPVVAEFEKDWRIAVTGEPVKEGNALWVKVSSDDGKIRGWANQNYIDYGPYHQNSQTQTEAPATQKITRAVPQNTAPASSSSPTRLLDVVPYKPSPHPTEQPAQVTNPNPKLKVGPNIRVLADENQDRPKESRPEIESNGIPRLKKRAP